MKEMLKFITNRINDLHDFVIDRVDLQAYPMLDKWIHFVLFAIAGTVVFFCVHALFRFLAKYGLKAISFVCTLAIVVMASFAIEIQQEITNRGHMSLADAIWGICGFICAFTIYVISKKVCSMAMKKQELRENTNLIERET